MFKCFILVCLGSPVPTHYVPRAVSPFKETHSGGSVTSSNHHDRDRDHQTPRKKQSGTNNAVAAVGILRALDPHLDSHALLHKDHPEESHHSSRSYEKKEKKSLWERASGRTGDKDKLRLKEKERRDEDGQELTRMIGMPIALIYFPTS